MPSTTYDERGLTPNQILALEFMTPNVWFDPDDNPRLRYIQSRNSVCISLSNKKILLKRPYSALGFLAWEYCLTSDVAEFLKIEHRELENDENRELEDE